MKTSINRKNLISTDILINLQNISRQSLLDKNEFQNELDNYFGLLTNDTLNLIKFCADAELFFRYECQKNKAL